VQQAGVPRCRDLPTAAQSRLRHGCRSLDLRFGPNCLLQQLRFRNGRLEDISSAGYGFYEDTQGHSGADDILVGMTKYELVHNYGESVPRHAAEVLAPNAPDGGLYCRANGVYAHARGHQHLAYREEWVQNFGSSYFLRNVILENGKVRNVENDDHGFNPQ
jgi:hypothetical protein